MLISRLIYCDPVRLGVHEHFLHEAPDHVPLKSAITAAQRGNGDGLYAVVRYDPEQICKPQTDIFNVRFVPPVSLGGETDDEFRSGCHVRSVDPHPAGLHFSSLACAHICPKHVRKTFPELQGQPLAHDADNVYRVDQSLSAGLKQVTFGICIYGILLKIPVGTDSDFHLRKNCLNLILCFLIKNGNAKHCCQGKTILDRKPPCSAAASAAATPLPGHSGKALVEGGAAFSATGSSPAPAPASRGPAALLPDIHPSHSRTFAICGMISKKSGPAVR